ncbi:MAG: pilus assembly protein PilM [Armatimonadota bacterium]
MSPSKKIPSAVVGIDIGSNSIKVAEAKLTKEGVTITSIAMAPTPEGVIQNEMIDDPKRLGLAIKDLLSQNGIKTKKCVSSVSSPTLVVVRVVEAPKGLSYAEMKETMKWEVERLGHFSSDDIMDFQVLKKEIDDPSVQNVEVLLAVANRKYIEAHVEALRVAGLQPMAIDINQLAASRALIDLDSNIKKDQVVAVANIGSSTSDVSIFEEGLLMFPSPSIGIAGSTFTNEIAEALGETPEQAEITKKHYAKVLLDAFDFGQDFDTGSDQVYNIGADIPKTIFDMDDTDEGMSISSNTVADIPASEPELPSVDLGAEAANLSDFGFDIAGDIGGGAPSFDSAPQDEGPAFDLGIDEDQEEASAESEETISHTEPATEAVPIDDVQTFFDQPKEDEYSSIKEDFEGFAAPEAEKKASSDDMESRVFYAISGALTNLAVELRRSLEYYVNRYSKMPEKIYICGGTARMKNLDQFLTRELGVPVEVGDPLKNIRVDVPAISPQHMKEISSMLPVCIGSAIRDMIG